MEARPTLYEDFKEGMTAEDCPPEKHRPLWAIAQEILKDWKAPYYAAVPYLDAMTKMDAGTGYVGHDSVEGIVTRFLGNSQFWRTAKAKQIKSELKWILGRK